MLEPISHLNVNIVRTDFSVLNWIFHFFDHFSIWFICCWMFLDALMASLFLGNIVDVVCAMSVLYILYKTGLIATGGFHISSIWPVKKYYLCE